MKGQEGSSGVEHRSAKTQIAPAQGLRTAIREKCWNQFSKAGLGVDPQRKEEGKRAVSVKQQLVLSKEMGCLGGCQPLALLRRMLKQNNGRGGRKYIEGQIMESLECHSEESELGLHHYHL